MQTINCEMQVQLLDNTKKKIQTVLFFLTKKHVGSFPSPFLAIIKVKFWFWLENTFVSAEL